MFDQIKKLLKQAIIYGSGGVAVQATRFLLIPLYTRLLTPEDYGILELITISFILLDTTSRIGLDQGFFMSYFAKSTDEWRQCVVSTITIFLTLTTLCLTCVLLIFARSISRLIIGNDQSSVLFMLMFISLFFRIVSAIPLQVLRANDKPLKYSILEFSRSALETILAVFFVVVLRKGVAGILSGQLIGYGVVFLCLILIVRNTVKIVFSFKLLRETINFGFPITISSLLDWLWRSTDRFLMKRFSSLDQVGLYSLGMRLSLPIALAVGAFHIAWFPFMYSITSEKNEENIHSRTLTYYFFIASFLWLIVSVGAKDIIRFMATPAFHDAYKVVSLLSGMQVLFGAYLVTRAGILLKEKTIYLSFIFAVTAGASIGMNLILIHRFGMIGAGITALVSSLILCSITYIVSRVLYPIHYEYRRIFKIVLTVIFLYFTSTLVRGAYSTVLILKLLIILSYPLLLGLLGFYDQREIYRIKLAGSKVLDTIGNKHKM